MNSPRAAESLEGESAAELLTYFNFVRRQRANLLERFGSPFAFCEALLEDCDHGLPETSATFLRKTAADLRDYVIATSYAILLGEEKRKQLSAYFTPPSLCSAVLAVAKPFLEETRSPRVLDPACGGGAFLVPIARQMIHGQISQGHSVETAAARTIASLRGFEVDPGLANLSRRLLAGMLKRDFDLPLGRQARAAVRDADTLRQTFDQPFDLVIGNPPYGRIGRRVPENMARASGRAYNGGHTNFYSLFLLKALDALRPGGMLIFILPTSFIAGPYFVGLRQEVLARASVVRLDLHEDRENLFVGAVQDVCVLVLHRHGASRRAGNYEIGLIDGRGVRQGLGSLKTPRAGEPWTIPVASGRRQQNSLANGGSRHFTVADYGYRLRVGKVVPTREREFLRTRSSKNSLPLIWASAVRPDGSFSATGGEFSDNPLWFCPPTKDPAYVTTSAAVLVQRTSNRDQQRRLNAAVVSAKFRAEHPSGFVAENHVIVIEATRKRPRVSPRCLAAILNASVTNERFAAVSGSFSVSARLLSRLALPDPSTLPDPSESDFEKQLESCFALIDGVLVPDAGADGTQYAVDEAADLARGVAVDDHSSLKAGRFTRPQKVS